LHCQCIDATATDRNRGYDPKNDYIPLLALLKRRLSNDEVAEVAKQLAESASLRACHMNASLHR
jgi:hypothetical protein